MLTVFNCITQYNFICKSSKAKATFKTKYTPASISKNIDSIIFSFYNICHLAWLFLLNLFVPAIIVPYAVMLGLPQLRVKIRGLWFWKRNRRYMK